MRCEFFNYLEALLRSPRPKTGQFLSYLIGYFIVAVSVYFGIAGMNFGALALSFLAGFVYIVGAMTGVSYFNNTPNLFSQMPMGPKKSLLYRFLSVLVLFVLMILIMLAIILVISLITTGIVLLIGGLENGNVPEGGDVSEEIEIINPMGVHGGIFGAAYFVFMYGAGMISGFLKKHKIRNIFTVSLCAVVLVGMILMRNPFIQDSYTKMAVPWLCTALCIAAALASLGTAVYMGIKQYNKKY